MLRTIRDGLRTLFRREAVERELDDEVQHYLGLATEAHVRAGMTPEAAARTARLEMGGVESTKDRVRSGGWETHVETVWRDVRYALRAIRRNPGFAKSLRRFAHPAIGCASRSTGRAPRPFACSAPILSMRRPMTGK